MRPYVPLTYFLSALIVGLLVNPLAVLGALPDDEPCTQLHDATRTHAEPSSP